MTDNSSEASKPTYLKQTKGGHGLPKDSFRLQTMTAFNEKLLRGVQGGGFLEKSPPGRRRQKFRDFHLFP
ncbi:MAG: hypothetical protein PVH61_35830 [Candidatus Aminicenantes bacterium]